MKKQIWDPLITRASLRLDVSIMSAETFTNSATQLADESPCLTRRLVPRSIRVVVDIFFYFGYVHVTLIIYLIHGRCTRVSRAKEFVVLNSRLD